MMVFDVHDDGSITANEIFIAWCGCGGMSATIYKALALADIPVDKYKMIKTTQNVTANKFLLSNGYVDLVPSLRAATHAALINPMAGMVVDLLEKDKEKLKQGIQDVIRS